MDGSATEPNVRKASRESGDTRGWNSAAGQQRTHFGGKQESAVRDRVIQRLDSQPVTRQKNLRVPRRFARRAGRTRIPDGKGKHAAEFAQTLFAPFLIGVDDDLGIRVSAERMPAPFERLAQLREIVDFAVENNRDIACFVEYGLVPTRQVNDAEAAHPERRRRSHQEPVFIRAAMPQRPHHPARNFFGQFGPLNSNDTTDSAHSALLYREPARSSTLTCKNVAHMLQLRSPLPATAFGVRMPHRISIGRRGRAAERLLEIFPGQFRDAVGHDGSQKRDRSRLSIGDDRKRVQQKLVAEQEYRRVDDVNAIRNAADVAQESEPHDRSQKRRAPRKHEEQQ